jgi:predicted nucleic acid-binding protein
LIAYADSSFLVSMYLTDQHSSEARRRAVSASRLSCTPLQFAEWAHVLAQHVFRGKLNSTDVAGLERAFQDDITAGIWQKEPLPERAFDICADLARRYGPKLGVRTLDSLHVACALELKADRFWTFDDRQAKLAKAEGLKIS